MNTLSVEQKYHSLGGASGFLGVAQNGKSFCADGKGVYRNFTNGAIFWHPALGAYEVRGGILNEWKQNDYERGFLGYPISDEMDWTIDDLRRMLPPDDSYAGWMNKQFPLGKWLKDSVINGEVEKLGRYSLFQGGCITWWDGVLPTAKEKHEWTWRRDLNFYIPATASTTNQKYLLLGGQNGFLGAPQTDEGTCADKRGRYRHYKNGSIFWHPDLGAYEVHGGILNEWKESDFERGILGYPITDEANWTLDDLRRMLPPDFRKWMDADVQVGKWIDEKLMAGEPSTIGRWSRFKDGCITWWGDLLPPEVEKRELIWTIDGDFYVPQFVTKQGNSKAVTLGPRIAEKVRFWEEQDKINQALIPRVIELHEKVVELSKHTTTATELIALTEARITEGIEQKVLGLHQIITPLNAKIETVDQAVKAVDVKANTTDKAIKTLNVSILAVAKDAKDALVDLTNVKKDNASNYNKLNTFYIEKTENLQARVNTIESSQASLENKIKEVTSKRPDWIIYLAIIVGVLALIISCLRFL